MHYKEILKKAKERKKQNEEIAEVVQKHKEDGKWEQIQSWQSLKSRYWAFLFNSNDNDGGMHDFSFTCDTYEEFIDRVQVVMEHYKFMEYTDMHVIDKVKGEWVQLFPIAIDQDKELRQLFQEVPANGS